MIVTLLLSLIVLTSGAEEGGTYWSYHGENGVDTWANIFPNCGGLKQSPINIVCKEVIKTNMECFDLEDYYEILPTLKIVNLNGKTIECIPNKTIKISGGGLSGSFTLLQFHFHWGNHNSEGSEHSINGNFYPLELHFVHKNDKYSTVAEASQHSDGLAVIGVFFKVGYPSSKPIQKITNAIKYIYYANEEIKIDFNLPLIELLPESDCEYYRYQGSLTTPGCNEAVIWTLLKRPVYITEKELAKLRRVRQSLPGEEEKLIHSNYRPPQPLNGRKVYGNVDCNF